MRKPLALGALAVALAAVAAVVVAFALASEDAHAPRATLKLDGKALRPELALTSAQRSRGLMHRKKAPKDGMLFVFSGPTRGGFWMKNTLVPLTIHFFDVHGKRVRTLRMTPCKRDPCKVYEPKRSYRFALELAVNDRRAAKTLGPRAELRRLIRLAD